MFLNALVRQPDHAGCQLDQQALHALRRLQDGSGGILRLSLDQPFAKCGVGQVIRHGRTGARFLDRRSSSREQFKGEPSQGPFEPIGVDGAGPGDEMYGGRSATLRGLVHCEVFDDSTDSGEPVRGKVGVAQVQGEQDGQLQGPTCEIG